MRAAAVPSTGESVRDPCLAAISADRPERLRSASAGSPPETPRADGRCPLRNQQLTPCACLQNKNARFQSRNAWHFPSGGTKEYGLPQPEACSAARRRLLAVIGKGVQVLAPTPLLGGNLRVGRQPPHPASCFACCGLKGAVIGLLFPLIPASSPCVTELHQLGIYFQFSLMHASNEPVIPVLRDGLQLHDLPEHQLRKNLRCSRLPWADRAKLRREGLVAVSL